MSLHSWFLARRAGVRRPSAFRPHCEPLEQREVPACIVSDAGWASLDGGCKDLQTGLVWSIDARVSTGSWWTWTYANPDFSPRDETRLPLGA